MQVLYLYRKDTECKFILQKQRKTFLKWSKNTSSFKILRFAGALAQLVERNNGIVEVSGSIPLRSMFLDVLIELSRFDFLFRKFFREKMIFLFLLALPFSHDLWLSQFEDQDQQIATELIDQVDYFSYERVCEDLKALYCKVAPKVEGHTVVYSKTYVAKSGDLISYFYRTSNKIPSILFKNLSDHVDDKSNKVLVLLEDYVGTGTQFLYRVYAKENYELFNQYKKVYLATLVANTSSIRKFNLIWSGQYELLADEFISFLDRPKDEETRNNMIKMLKRIPSEKLELIYLHEEKPLSDNLDPLESVKISALIDKYGKYSMETNFFKGLTMDSYGRTAFFYNCPNNLPAILWDSNLKQSNGQSWTPLLKRTEDISIYERAQNLPIEKQVRQ